MNNRSYLVGILVVVLLLLGGWWFWTSKQVNPAEAPVQAAPTSSTNTVVPSGTTSQPNASTANPASPSRAAALARLAEFQGAIDEANGRSLDFYGKVIDQNGQPVVDAKVKGYVMTGLGFDGTKETLHLTQTDAEGDFEFLGLHGIRLGVGPEKEGYQFIQRGNGNWSLDQKTDPGNRTIFHMWKFQGAEPIVAYSISTAIPCNGTPTSYDLLTGKKVSSGGDFVITLTRNPVNIVRGQPFDWSVTLQIPGGGLTDMNDLYPNEAPADGYQPSVTINMPANMQNWSPVLNRSFYFEGGSGQTYGRMTINIHANFQPPPTYFGADVYLNPSPGDRNLEFDPTQAIKP